MENLRLKLRKMAILKWEKEQTQTGDIYGKLTFIGIPIYKKIIERKD